MDRQDSEKLIIELNYKNDLVDERLKSQAFNSRKMFDLLPETIIDKRSLEVVEIHDLFKALDHTITHVGSAHLFHSLVNPSESIELIHAKQDSYCELESNTKLQGAVADFLTIFNEGEAHLFKFLNAHMQPLVPYRDFTRAMDTINRALEAVESIPQPETMYLDSLITSIKSLHGSRVSKLAKGPVYRTFQGVCSKAEKSLLTPALRFRPSRISGGLFLPSVPGLFFGAAWLFEFLNPAVALSFFFITSWLSIAGVVYASVLKPMFDYESAILPIRKIITDSNRFASAIEAIAAIDELLSFVNYSHALAHPTVMPEITNGKKHYFAARELRNPIMAKADPEFVSNDVNLDDVGVSFITGPNSGGKTTYCKTIVQNQILGQIGAPVVAKSARMNMTDMITYQAPSFDTLNDQEGRFGTELKITRDIFYNVTPKSLTILDEIAEGTTTHEKMGFSVDIMNGFYAIGCNTLLVTHSYELVERFQQQGKGQFLQVEYDGAKPTHRMVEGISKDSHAYRVAKKIGFAPEDIMAHLVEKGYLPDTSAIF